MKSTIATILGALCVVACSHGKPADTANVTTITRATEVKPAVTSQEIKTVIIARRPGSAKDIDALAITNDNGVVTLRGHVEDEATHNEVVSTVRSMANVKAVRDELQVLPMATASGAGDKYGLDEDYDTTTTTAGEMDKKDHADHEKGEMTKSGAVRKHLEEAAPKSVMIIRGLIITDDGEIVTLKGIVPDEPTHQRLAKAARETPDVKDIKDELKVQKKHKAKK